MPPEKTPENEPEEKNTANDPALAELVASVTAHGDKVLEAVKRSTAPADPVPPTGPSFEDEQKAYGERLAAAKSKYKELNDDAKWDEALEVMETVYATAPRQKTDMADNVLVKATKLNVGRNVRAEFSDIVESYGDEVTTSINALSLEDQLDETKVRDAIRRVKSMHMDDLIEAGVKEKFQLERDRLAGLAPGNVPNPSLGEADDTELHGLDPKQRQFAKAMGVDYKSYAGMAKRLDSGSDEILSAEEMP